MTRTVEPNDVESESVVYDTHPEVKKLRSGGQSRYVSRTPDSPPFSTSSLRLGRSHPFVDATVSTIEDAHSSMVASVGTDWAAMITPGSVIALTSNADVASENVRQSALDRALAMPGLVARARGRPLRPAGATHLAGPGSLAAGREATADLAGGRSGARARVPGAVGRAGGARSISSSPEAGAWPLGSAPQSMPAG
jgi:hypothetical protein